jgi:hypothetical protein
MSRDPAQINRAVGLSGLQKIRRNIKERVIDEATRFVVMFLYLWLVFGLFVLQQSVIMAQRHIDDYVQYGVAAMNALIFAKVMLVAEDLDLGRRFQDMPLIVPILYKSFVFSLVFLCFHIVENIVIGQFQGKGVLESLPMIGGDLKATVSAVLIFTFELVPYFAYREIGRVIGVDKIYSLVFADRRKTEPRIES